jgi:hypothetical protein
MQAPSTPDDTSWWDELSAGLSQKQTPPPPPPQPPPVDQSAWEKSVEQAKVSDSISTQSGPYNNTYTAGQVPSRTAWLNTYWNK